MREPLYRQIAEDLMRRIESGEMRRGSQLPTELELMDSYNASRNTVRDAVKWLITRGLVETRPGQGTFVVEKIDPFVTTLSADPETGQGRGEGAAYVSEVRATGREPDATVPRVEIHQASGIVAAELQVDEGTSLVSRHQQRLIDHMPYSLQTSFYPMDLVARGATRLIEAADISQGTVAYLSQALAIEQAGYRDMITVRAPDTDEIKFFKLPDNGRVAVFENFRTAFDEQGVPFRLTVTVYPADRNEFVINVGDVPEQSLKRGPLRPDEARSALKGSAIGTLGKDSRESLA
jgi:GntR family transcriptional regulator